MPFDREQPFNDLPSLPPPVQLETERVLKQTIATARALEGLRGTAQRLPNPRLLVNTVALQEARSSSEIENIVTTNDELYRVAAGAEDGADPAAKEILRYREALWYGFDQIQRRPFSTSLFVEIVGIVRQTSVGVRSLPGTSLKNAQGQVLYTPPEGRELLHSKLFNMERYLHEAEVDPLIRMAVGHYQFEAIHPFSDGNGRTGRILNTLFLVDQKLLDLPILYLSKYILEHKQEYYLGLRAVTEANAWEEWVLYMLRAVEETARTTSDLIRALLALMEETARSFRQRFPSTYSKDLFEIVFSNPYSRTRFLEDILQVSRPTAAAYLKKLSVAGVLREQKIGRDVYYINDAMTGLLRMEADPGPP